MRKGITPIVSIIILLLIGISLAGSAWLFISGYWGSMIGKAIQMAPGSELGNTVMIQNMGEKVINPDEITVMVNGKESIIMNPQPIDPMNTAIISFIPGDLIDPANDIWEIGPLGSYADVRVAGPANSFKYTVELDFEFIRNLVRNGDFEQGNTAGWIPVSIYFGADRSDPHGGLISGRVTGKLRPYSSDFIPYTPNDTVHIEFYAKSTGSGGPSRIYAGFREYDKDKNFIEHYQVQYFENTKTTLAADLNPSDNTVSLTSGANWKDPSSPVYQRYIGFWNTGDYPDYTYTRTTALYDNILRMAPPLPSGDILTLTDPWSGPTIPAGTSVANMFAGSGFNYIAASSAYVPVTWTEYNGNVSGWKYGATTAYNKFRYGTRYIRASFLFNYQQDNTYQILFDDVRVWVER